MMLLRSIEKYFWVFFIGAILSGLASASIGIWLENALRYFLMAILFFTSLKIDFRKILTEATHPYWISYVVLIRLVVSPLLWYYATLWVFPKYALGILILNSMPSAMYSGIMSDLAGGSIERAFSGTFFTSLLCPITIPLMTNLLIGQPIHPGVILERVGFLVMLIFIPFLLAGLLKRLFPTTVERYSFSYTPLSTVSACFLIAAGISKSRNLVFENMNSVIYLIPYLMLIFAFLLFLGYFSAFFFSKKDRIASAINTAFMNNGLAIVFSITYLLTDFGPKAILPSVLIEIPMAFMIVPFRCLVNRDASRRGGPG